MRDVSYVVWGVWVGLVIISFLSLEISGLLHIVPWVTLSETTWRVETFAIWLKFIVFVFFTFLAAHLATGWPS